jgi:murein DD-endopeptidase MepM/ murein hydrolase activator NlpD
VTSDGVSGPGVGAGVDPSSAASVPARDPQREQVRRLAQEFEAMLMTQMLREMRRSMLSDDDEAGGGLGRDTMTDTMDIELGQALSRVGGFGLSGLLLKAIERGVGLGGPVTIGSGQPATMPAVPSDADSAQELLQAAPTPFGVEEAVSPPDAVAPSEAVAPPEPETGASGLRIPVGHVTSAYGWRRDPFTGTPRFHKGIDVAQAYGQDVPAAGAGRVVFAGDRGNYGTTVVVEHSSGQQTLYAHLSAADVRAGEQVDAGQVIGRTGDSGRATGPHLHFEVVEAERAIKTAHRPRTSNH